MTGKTKKIIALLISLLFLFTSFSLIISAVDEEHRTEVTGDNTASPGESVSFTAKYYVNNVETATTFTWACSSSISSISENGVLTVSESETATSITVTATPAADSGVSGTATVSIETIKVTSINLSESSISIIIGETKTITATVLPANATNSALIWTSSDDAVATVDNQGVVSAIESGTATIRAAASDGSGIFANCAVTVTKIYKNYMDDIYLAATIGETLYLQRKSSILEFIESAYEEATGKGLQRIVFESAGYERGLLYDSKGSLILEGIEYSNITGIYYVPQSQGNEKIILQLYSSASEYITLTININVLSSDTQAISYTSTGGAVVEFDGADFNDLSLIRTGHTLSKIYFELPQLNKGVLAYNYISSTSYSTPTSGTAFYFQSNPKISSVVFIPASSFTGLVEIKYTAHDISGNSFEGVVKITSGSVNKISYKIDKNGYAAFNKSDFNDICAEYTDETLDYVVFTLPSSSYGELCYYLQSRTSYESKVTAAGKYYLTQSPYLAAVAFIPNSTYTGVFKISYKAYSISGLSYDGEIEITVTEPSIITYSAKAGKELALSENDFISLAQSFTGEALEYIMFDLPSSSVGSLTYNFGNSVAVNSSYKYYRSSSPYIKYVNFTSADSYSGTAEITYTAYTENASYMGKIKITVEGNPSSESKSKSDYFSDVNSVYSWGAGAIDSLYDQKIVTGVTSNTFSPSANIKRGDFILMLYRAYDLKADFTENFSDVPESSYYYEAIGVAKALGIAQGQGDNKFNPDAFLTRQDAFVLVMRTLEKVKVSLSKTTTIKFNDEAKISSYALEASKALAEAGIIKGDNNGNMNPTSSLTRIEMAVILYRILNI